MRDFPRPPLVRLFYLNCAYITRDYIFMHLYTIIKRYIQTINNAKHIYNHRIKINLLGSIGLDTERLSHFLLYLLQSISLKLKIKYVKYVLIYFTKVRIFVLREYTYICVCLICNKRGKYTAGYCITRAHEILWRICIYVAKFGLTKLDS